MVRHPRFPSRLALAALVAVALAGCGIKGPLVPAPKADAKADAAKPADGASPAPRDKRTEPKL